MKNCAKCNTEKNDNEFYRDRSRPDGLMYTCKECKSAAKKKYRKKNKEKIRLADEAYRRAKGVLPRGPKMSLRERAKYQKKWQKDNRKKINIKRMFLKYRETERRNRARNRNAVPGWFNLAAVRDIYLEAMERRIDGEDVVVDHIVPLGSLNVCGLHTADNLRIITARENSLKSELHWPDMPQPQKKYLATKKGGKVGHEKNI